MQQASLLSQPAHSNVLRRDTLVATVFAIAGFIALLVAQGGIENMIAGSVGSVGAGCLAVGLTFLDERLSYAQRVQASLPIILMLAGAGVAIKGHALALAGYPLLLLGVAGLVPAMNRRLKAASETAPASEKPLRERQVTFSA